jgi:hypothetical protein
MGYQTCVTGVCGVGKFFASLKSQDHSQCPRCNAEHKDHHIFKLAFMVNRLKTPVLNKKKGLEGFDLAQGKASHSSSKTQM